MGGLPPAAPHNAASHHDLLQCAIAVQYVAVHNETGTQCGTLHRSNYVATPQKSGEVDVKVKQGCEYHTPLGAFTRTGKYPLTY